MFKQIYAMFYKPSITPNYRRVARNFHRGKYINQVSTFKYLMLLYLKHHPYNVHLSSVFVLDNCVQILAGK